MKNKIDINWGCTEIVDQPKMIEVYLEQAWHSVFCYSLALETPKHQYQYPKLLMTIVSGADSALQSLKAAIDIGSNGLSFGHGEKTAINWSFKKDFPFSSEKGKYTKFPMTINQNRKALCIVHDDVLTNSEYVLSMEGNPAKDIATLLGGSKYGLHILPEWEVAVYEELKMRRHLTENKLYYDEDLFPNGLNLLSINLSEEEADLFISELIKKNIITFSKEGQGEEIDKVENLTDYMLSYNEAMVEKLGEEVKPTHDPMVDPSFTMFDHYPRTLFPVQSHVATAVSKRLKIQKSVVIQGEMSTGKSSIMTAIADGTMAQKGRAGYFVCLMVPPSLTSKWPDEIRELLPHAEIHVIEKSEELIRYHSNWRREGSPKPKRPTFFIISFTTMRGDSRTVPAVHFETKKTTAQGINEEIKPYRNGYYCQSCGEPHQTIEDTTMVMDEAGVEIEEHITHNMDPLEFGESRRIKNGMKPANAFCSHCGDSLWTKKVPVRFSSFKEWSVFEKRVTHAVQQGNPRLVKQVQTEQPDFPKVVGMPRRIAAVEYIRRRMKNFFDLTICDEVHELKGGMTAQGNALGSIASVSKRVVAGTGTLFGGKAEDVYYLLWRLFPNDMVKSGFQYHEVSKFNEEYGNTEKTIHEKNTSEEYSNTNSRGGVKRSEKVVPGISPFIFGKFMVHNIINVRLKDVWPDPVELVDTPTIFVDMDEELKKNYQQMIHSFESAIDKRDDGYKLYLPMTDYGIAYPDNPFSFPDSELKGELIWSALHLDENHLLPKEKKLQEIITNEMEEGRKSIVYVRDTGSSREGRDLRPRLKKVLSKVGAKVCILDASTTATNKRSEWLKKKIEEEDYDVCIVSQELVKVGLDLLCTPTLIYYQFSWSLFTINQSSRRSFRIGQTEECRLFYLAYRDTFQETMATLIAQKNRATAAINGEVSTDGLSAMLGDDGDLQSMLIESVKSGKKVMRGSTEDWVSQYSERAREILANIGKKKEKISIEKQFMNWIVNSIQVEATKNVLKRESKPIVDSIKKNEVPGFVIKKDVLVVDLVNTFGMEYIPDGAILAHLTRALRAPTVNVEYDQKIIISSDVNKKKRANATEGQLTFDLFG
jgi:hypothetical protein